MKRIFIVAIIIFISSCSSSKQYLRGKKGEIVKSYSHILNHYGKELDVFNTSKKFDIVNFIHRITKDPDEDINLLIDSIGNMKLSDKSNKNFLILKNLPKNINNNSDLKVFFSIQYEDYVIVEVFKKRADKENTYKELTTFGSSDVFLFKFKEEKVSKTYQITMDYN